MPRLLGRGRTLPRRWLGPGLLGLALSGPGAALAAGPPPSGPHPRLFLNPELLGELGERATDASSSTSRVIEHCQQIVDNPEDTMGRGYQGDGWSYGASACGMAWQVTGDPAFAEAGLRLLHTLLADDQSMGDGLACSSTAVSAEQATLSIRHDTGYAIRFIGPHAALAYDWLYDAPGMDDTLRELSLYCFRQWIDFYTTEGYHHDEPGSNYHAGYAVAKTFIAIAAAGEGGADGDRIWEETVDGLFAEQLVGDALEGAGAAFGEPAGALVGGDWPEGWQYGILSTLEYVLATRALEEAGEPQPELDDWTNSLMLRYFHALEPSRDGIYVGGDFEDERIYAEAPEGVLQAVLIGGSSDDVAGQAASERVRLGSGAGDSAFDAIAETRVVEPVDFWASDPSLWFVARGTSTLFARNS